MAGWAGIARFGGVGDNLISSAVLRPLKRMGYKTEVITGGSQAVVFNNNPFIDKLTIKQDGDIPGGDAGTQWYLSRSKEYDIFAHLSFTCEHSHALHNNTPGFWWRPDYRRKMCAGSYLETACDVVGVSYDFGPLFFPTDEEKARAIKTRDEQIGGKYIAWVISGSRIDKVYPYAGMAIGRLIKETGLPVVMFGVGGKQFDMAKAMMEHIQRQNSSSDKLHLALSPDNADPGGEQSWPIRRSLSQILAADLVITPDTGLAWGAAMEQMPKIVMVSHASAENITKHWINTTTLHADPNKVPCWPCHRLHNDMTTCTPNADGGHAAACISDISVDAIIETAHKALKTPVKLHVVRDAA